MSVLQFTFPPMRKHDDGNLDHLSIHYLSDVDLQFNISDPEVYLYFVCHIVEILRLFVLAE